MRKYRIIKKGYWFQGKKEETYYVQRWRGILFIGFWETEQYLGGCDMYDRPFSLEDAEQWIQERVPTNEAYSFAVVKEFCT